MVLLLCSIYHWLHTAVQQAASHTASYYEHGVQSPSHYSCKYHTPPNQSPRSTNTNASPGTCINLMQKKPARRGTCIIYMPWHEKTSATNWASHFGSRTKQPSTPPVSCHAFYKYHSTPIITSLPSTNVSALEYEWSSS